MCVAVSTAHGCFLLLQRMEALEKEVRGEEWWENVADA